MNRRSTSSWPLPTARRLVPVIITCCLVTGCLVSGGAARAAGADPPAAATLGVAPAQAGLNFVNDVLPLLTKHGCNSGGCHGRGSGQNGFKLSLFGFDPEADYAALVQEGLGRRISWTAPEESLLLAKPTGQCRMAAACGLSTDSAAYELINRWIADGSPWGQADVPILTGIQVEPSERLLDDGQTQQLKVVASYSDGTTRDVTATAEYFSAQPADLAVSPRRSGPAAGWPRRIDHHGALPGNRHGFAFFRALHRNLPEQAYALFEPKSFVDRLVLEKWRNWAWRPARRPATPSSFAGLSGRHRHAAQAAGSPRLSGRCVGRQAGPAGRSAARTRGVRHVLGPALGQLAAEQAKLQQRRSQSGQSEVRRLDPCSIRPEHALRQVRPRADRRHRQGRRSSADGLVPADQHQPVQGRGHVAGVSRSARVVRQLPQSSVRAHLANRLLAVCSLFRPGGRNGLRHRDDGGREGGRLDDQSAHRPAGRPQSLRRPRVSVRQGRRSAAEAGRLDGRQGQPLFRPGDQQSHLAHTCSAAWSKRSTTCGRPIRPAIPRCSMPWQPTWSTTATTSSI